MHTGPPFVNVEVLTVVKVACRFKVSQLIKIMLMVNVTVMMHSGIALVATAT
jgi:hypothetical protein